MYAFTAFKIEEEFLHNSFYTQHTVALTFFFHRSFGTEIKSLHRGAFTHSGFYIKGHQSTIAKDKANILVSVNKAKFNLIVQSHALREALH